MSDMAKEVLDLKKVEEAMVEKHNELIGTIEKANEEAKNAGSVANETKSAIDGISGQLNDIGDRLHEMEQKGAHGESTDEAYDIGAEFVKSEQFQAFAEGRQNGARMEVKTAIVNATGQNQPLVDSDRLGGINATPNRVLSIRDIIPTSQTDSNLIEFVRENVFTNSAGPQYSSPNYENVAKAESGITFTLVNEPVQTLAHFLPASKQVIADSAQLQSYISGRLMYGLKLYEEAQLLSGSAASGQLNGLITQATSYTAQSPALTNELDIIRDAIKQAHQSEYMPDAIVLNPSDWYDIEVRKVGTSDDRYVVGNPRSMMGPTLWGLPVVVTNSIAAGTFLLGSFGMGAEIKDRMNATVEVSREHSDNFTKNMVTILAEERIALCVYRTEAFITGSL